MKWSYRALFVVASGIVPAVHGCGGGGFNSSLDGSKQLKDVTQEEAKTFCEESLDYAESAIGKAALEKYSCAVVTILTAGGSMDPKATCQMVFDECTANPTALNCENAGLPPCNATVDEYEKCTEEAAGTIKDFVDTFSCDNIAEYTDGSFVVNGPICKKIQDNCGSSGS